MLRKPAHRMYQTVDSAQLQMHMTVILCTNNTHMSVLLHTRRNPETTHSTVQQLQVSLHTRAGTQLLPLYGADMSLCVPVEASAGI